MTTDERIDKLEKRVELVEHCINDREKAQIKDKYELKELISKAVAEGNEKLIEMLNKHELRIIALENKDGEKAKAVIKAIVGTSLSWLVMGLLTNLPAIFY